MLARGSIPAQHTTTETEAPLFPLLRLTGRQGWLGTNVVGNAGPGYIYPGPSPVLIAYLLCGECAQEIMTKQPKEPTSMHKAIEDNLVSAYLHYLNSLT